MEKHPNAPLVVYAVWFNMVSSDSRSAWPNNLLTDPRVHHFWDESKFVGTWYGENLTQKARGHVEWDAYFLYASDAEWPGQLINWGRTIVATRSELSEQVSSLFGEH